MRLLFFLLLLFTATITNADIPAPFIGSQWIGATDNVTATLADRSIIISPTPVGDLTWARATAQATAGRVTVEWRISNSTLQINVQTPDKAKTRINYEKINHICRERGLKPSVYSHRHKMTMPTIIHAPCTTLCRSLPTGGTCASSMM